MKKIVKTSKEKCDIIIIAPAYPYRGGQALVEAHLFHELTKAGFSVRTITFTLLYPSIFFPGTTQYDKSSFVPYPHTDRIERLINSIWPPSWIRTALKIKNYRPHMVIFVWWMPFFGPAYWTIAKFSRFLCPGVKIVFLVENYISHEERWFDMWLSKRTLSVADAFICESRHVGSAIRANHPEKPLYITTLPVYSCYDLGRYTKESARKTLGLPLDAKVILSAGLIRPYKGIDQLIRAFPLIRQQEPHAHLLIVGEAYEHETKYINLIRESGCQERITFLNKFVPNEELELFYKAADVVCLPYYSATQSGILMIAYAFGIPVVATRVGALAELVVHNKTGKLIDSNEPSLIARATVELLNEPREPYEKAIRQLTQTLGYRNIPEIIKDILKLDESPDN